MLANRTAGDAHWKWILSSNNDSAPRANHKAPKPFLASTYGDIVASSQNNPTQQESATGNQGETLLQQKVEAAGDKVVGSGPESGPGLLQSKIGMLVEQEVRNAKAEVDHIVKDSARYIDDGEKELQQKLDAVQTSLTKTVNHVPVSQTQQALGLAIEEEVRHAKIEVDQIVKDSVKYIDDGEKELQQKLETAQASLAKTAKRPPVSQTQQALGLAIEQEVKKAKEEITGVVAKGERGLDKPEADLRRSLEGAAHALA